MVGECCATAIAAVVVGEEETNGTRELKEPPVWSKQPGAKMATNEVDSTNDVTGAGTVRGGYIRGGGGGKR